MKRFKSYLLLLHLLVHLAYLQSPMLRLKLKLLLTSQISTLNIKHFMSLAKNYKKLLMVVIP